jgi:hypothetical protein
VIYPGFAFKFPNVCRYILARVKVGKQIIAAAVLAAMSDAADKAAARGGGGNKRSQLAEVMSQMSDEEVAHMLAVGAVQVELSWAHNLKAPGFNPKNCKVISWFQSFAYKFNLYRYTTAADSENAAADPEHAATIMTMISPDKAAAVTTLVAVKKKAEAVKKAETARAAAREGRGNTVGLYKLNPVDQWLESAWFQPLGL